MNSSKILHRNTKKNIPLAVYAKGLHIKDNEGRWYLDASSGACISSIGHNNTVVSQAINKQLAEIEFAHSSFFTNKPAEELAELIINLSSEKLGFVHYVCGGSEANEAAMKLARQYFVEKGETERSIFIARKQSYHGATIGALSITQNYYRRTLFEEILVKNVEFISPCYPYRQQKNEETEIEYSQRLVDELEETILKVGPNKIIAFIAETISGTTLGAVLPSKDYFKKIREICDKYGILLILDEVLCGCGRTGEWNAYDSESISPDLVTLAKGLGAGYQPIGAVVISKEIYDVIKTGTGVFRHGHSYNGHPIACAAALAVQRYIIENDLLKSVKIQGKKLYSMLQDCFSHNSYIGDIRGKGLLIGIELVKNKFTKEPFDPNLQVHTYLKQIGMENGLLCYPMSGCVDGVNGTHIVLAPPFTISDQNCTELTEKLEKTINDTVSILKL